MATDKPIIPDVVIKDNRGTIPGVALKDNRTASEKAAQEAREGKYNKGGIVGPNVQKWGSPKVSAPCKDSKTIKCY